MNTLEEQRKLSESLLQACKAAGIEKPKYIAQDKDGFVCHYTEKPTLDENGIEWSDRSYDRLIAIPPNPLCNYADDWQDSLMEWVEPQVENFNITKSAAMAKWRNSFAFTESEKQQIEDYAVAENEPLANVLARHPDHIADTSKMIDDYASQGAEIDPYNVMLNGVLLDPYRIAVLYQLNDPIVFQILKKALRFGRKHKSRAKDVTECITSGIRWLEIHSPADAEQFKKGGAK